MIITKRKARFLSLIITLLMVFALMPQSEAFVYADDSTDPFQVEISNAAAVSAELGTLYQSIKDIRGFDEVAALVKKTKDEIDSAGAALNDAVAFSAAAKSREVDSSAEEEQLKEAIFKFTSENAPDPGGFQRDLDVIAADCNACIADTQYALIQRNYKMAERALLEFLNLEETMLNAWEARGAGTLANPGAITKEGIIENHDNMLKKKDALADKQKSYITEAEKAGHALENAVDSTDDAASYISDAENKTNELISNPGTGNTEQYTEKLAEITAAKTRVNNFYNNCSRLTLPLGSSWNSLLEEADHLSVFRWLDEARNNAAELLIPTFFITANDLTYNGKNQSLVTLSPLLVDNMDPQVKYALGDAPRHVPADLVYSAYPALDEMQQQWGTEPPADSEFDTAIPERTEPGTYYVYFAWDTLFSDDFITIKVTISKADPDYNVPSGLTAASGQTLADVKLPASDNGRWEWMNSTASVGRVGTNTFKARFVPNDTKHYNTINNISIPVKVKTAAGDTVSKTAGINVSGFKTEGKNGLIFTWTKVDRAEGYDIFFSKCSSKDKASECRKVKTIKGNKTFTWTKTGLKAGKAYKGYVKAWVMKNGKKKYISTGPMIHALTAGWNKTYTNVKGVKVNKKKVTLAKGKTFRIKAKVIKLKKNRKLLPSTHAPKLRYKSSDTKVATVNRYGRIRAKGKGSCCIYVYAHNGVFKKVKVTVN